MSPPTLAPHAEYSRLERTLSRLLATKAAPWRGTAFRFSAGRYSDLVSIVSGRGAYHRGSRWIPPGITPALHAAATPETAFAESLARHRRENIPEWQAMPLVVRGLEIRLSLVLDLADGAVRRSIRVAERRMTSATWTEDNLAGRESLPQAIGRAAFVVGFQGMLAPSAAAARSTTIVVFPENFDAQSYIRAM